MASTDAPFERPTTELAARSRRHRKLLRVVLPIAGVVLMIGAILGIALYTDRANRVGVLGLSNDLLNELDGRIAQQVSTYLDPAGRAMSIINDTLYRYDRQARVEMFVRIAASALRAAPQIAQFLAADRDGNFLQVRRGEAGTIEYKRIMNTPGNRVVEWVHLDQAGQEVQRTPDPTDSYDPRTRPWFTGALRTDGVAWTGVYIFFTDKAPGITASRHHADPDGRVVVYGADIQLSALSRFLATLKIGSSGRALIMDSSGTLIALPDARRTLRQDGDTLAAARLDQLDDPVLVAAYDHYRVQGYGRRIITLNGRRYISMVSHLPAAGMDWAVMIVVPEDDFTGFVTANQRTAVAMSLTVVALAAVLAGLLVAQGLRADRIAQQLRDRSQAIERQRAAFATLAADSGMFDAGDPEASRRLTETLAEACAARRASIWHLAAGGTVLRCEDSYELASAGHTDGLELSRAEAPQFFTHLLNGEEIMVADAASDRRTRAVHRAMMHALGSRSLLVVPVRRADGVAGAVWLEDAAADTQDLARAVAGMLAMRMQPSPADAAPHPEQAAAPAAAVVTQRSFEAELAIRGLDPNSLGAEVFPAVAVMVLCLADPAALAAKGASDINLADRIARALQEIALGNRIPYLKLSGQEAVAAAGFDPQDSDAVQRIAAMAMTVRDRLQDLYDEAEQAVDFRIGVDVGIGIGSPVGDGPRLFNLWGEVVTVAGTMATSAPMGSVQVTEAAYRHLSRGFLFRPRGSFWLPRIGETRMFVLAGQV